MEVILREDIDKLGARGAGGEGRGRVRPQFPAAQKAGGRGHRFEPKDRRAGAPGASAQGSERVGEAQDLAKLVGAVTVTISARPAKTTSSSAP